jgi:signal transduction histidine kinase
MERIGRARALAGVTGAGLARCLSRLFEVLARRAAPLAVVVGVSVLAAWALGLVVSRSGYGPLPPMRPNLAASFVLAGLALWLRRRGSRLQLRSIAADTFAVLVLMLGATTVLEYVLGHDLGVDDLLVAANGHPESLRMALPAAVATTLVGAALLLLDGRNSACTRLARWLAVTVLATTLVGALGFVPRWEALSSWSSPAPIAAHALVVFGCLALALLAEPPLEAPDVGAVLGAEVAPASRPCVAERMAGLGTLGAAVAHQVNNALMVVIGNLDLALRDMALLHSRADPAGTGVLRDDLTRALAGAERVRRAMRNLRMLSRRDEHQAAAVDVAAAVEAALELAGDDLRPETRLIKQLQPGLRVAAAPGRLHQLFLNLLLNAAEAVDTGRGQDGRIDGQIEVWTFSARGGRVTIEIADTGPGMPPAVREQLLRPPLAAGQERGAMGLGLGLGLTISQLIVASLGGAIEVDDRPGGGTVVRVQLRAAAAQ